MANKLKPENETIFSKIIRNELPSEKIFENERILAIKDIYPAAPVHILIFPKKQIKNLQAATAEDLELIKEILSVAQTIAHDLGISENYRLITNNGEKAGQSIFHLHFHLIGGKQLGPLA